MLMAQTKTEKLSENTILWISACKNDPKVKSWN